MSDMELAEEIEQRTKYMPECGLEIDLPTSAWQQIIAALRRGPERPPPGEMVMIKTLKEWERALDACVAALKDHEEAVPSATKALHELHTMLSAAEASKEAR